MLIWRTFNAMQEGIQRGGLCGRTATGRAMCTRGIRVRRSAPESPRRRRCANDGLAGDASLPDSVIVEKNRDERSPCRLLVASPGISGLRCSTGKAAVGSERVPRLMNVDLDMAISVCIHTELSDTKLFAVRPEDANRYVFAVLHVPSSRGGSRHIHEQLRAGLTVSISGSRNHFPLDEDDIQGQCTELPSVPNLACKMKIKAYPCVERGDVVWAYMGPEDKHPAPPDLEWCSEHLVATDKPIVMARRMLARAVRALGEGVEPPALDGASQRVRAASVLLQRDQKVEEWASQALSSLEQPVFTV